MKNIIILFSFCVLTSVIYTQDTQKNKSKLTTRSGLIISYWQELAIKPGLVLGSDWEFMNKQGHGVAFTFPNILFFYFPNNYFSFSLYPVLSYRFVHPKNGFYTSLSMGFGLNVQWKTVPVYNMEGHLIKDTGFHRMIATAQWDLGYDFDIKYNTPLRIFTSLGWKGIFPNNLGINSHIMFQLGVNVKLGNLANNSKTTNNKS